jgi:hypothetical protein
MPVGINLANIVAPGSTPIARNAASQITFDADYYKLAVPNISTRDRKAISIIGLIYELAAGGIVNYKLQHKLLRQDAAVYTGGISMFDLATGMAATDWNGGRNADATLSTDIPTLLQDGRGFADQSEDELDRIIVFLRAQLLK